MARPYEPRSRMLSTFSPLTWDDHLSSLLQALNNGYQVELPDIWLTSGNPWELRRDDVRFEIGFGGRVERRKQGNKEVTVWTPSERVSGRLTHATTSLGRVPLSLLNRQCFRVGIKETMCDVSSLLTGHCPGVRQPHPWF